MVRIPSSFRAVNTKRTFFNTLLSVGISVGIPLFRSSVPGGVGDGVLSPPSPWP